MEPRSNIEKITWNEAFKLDPLQTKAVIKTIEAWNGVGYGERIKKALVVACTGFGKTIYASRLIYLAKNMGYKSLFLVDRDELVNQTSRKLYDTTGIIADIEKAESRASLEADAVIASVQSLSQERLARFPKDHFKVVIADECHLSLAPSWQRALKHFEEHANFVGLTATPMRGDGKSLNDFWQAKVFDMPLSEGIKNGLLVPIKVHEIEVGIDVSVIEEKVDEQTKLADAMQPLWDDIIDQWSAVAANRKTLWFLPSRASSRAFAEHLRSRGHSAKHVQGDSEDRAAIIQEFASSGFTNLCNAVLLMTGYDDPSISCIVPLRAMSSKVQYQQSIGRGTRLNCPHGCRRLCNHDEAKKDMILIDIFGSFSNLSVMTPADLVADTPEAVEAVKKSIRGVKGKDLMEIAADTVGAREIALLQAIKRAKKYGRKTVYDARAVAAFYGDHELFDFDAESMGTWQSQPPFPEQIDTLVERGVDPSSIKNRGHARALIELLSKARKDHLPTVLQIGKLNSAGIDARGMSFKEASEKIENIYGRSKYARRQA